MTNSKERKSLGNKIRKLRKDQGYSQESLADKVGFHRTYIGAIERGEQNVSLDNIVKIAKTHKVKPSDLLN
ncbi:MAG: helix-turn-helix transcriptional regulator [Candidatus Saccharibacteria bacterium]|nr:helix-turn-helix transcriptional regulator [Candidatus Saccharibacteria bacterium]